MVRVRDADRRQLRRLTVLRGAGVAAAAAVARTPPHVPGLACPFRTVVGIDCPGCGSTRALTALAHGDLAGAANYNLLVPFALVAIAAHLATRRRGEGLLNRHRVAGVVAAVTLSFWLLRLTDTAIGHWLASTPQ